MRDRVVARRDRRRIGERSGQPLRKQPRARRRHGAVDRGEQRARAFARKRAHQLEIAAGGLVDQQGRALRLAHRRGERRALAELRALDIGDAGGRGGELEPRQRAEGVAGGDRKVIREPPLGGGAVEHVAGKRRHRRQRAQIGRQLGVAVERVRHDDLAGLEPRDLGRDAGAVALGDAEFAGGNVDPGERELVRRRAGPRDRQQIIVAAGIEQRVLGERAGGDQAHHVAPHHALAAAFARLGGVLELLAHGDAMAERDQAVQILVGRDGSARRTSGCRGRDACRAW